LSVKPKESVIEHPEQPDLRAAFADFEHAGAAAGHGLQRWIMSCAREAGLEQSSLIDVLVLHHVFQHGTHQRLAAICFVLNIEESHVVAYAIRKLVRRGLMAARRDGKDKTYALTALGHERVLRYFRIREQRLLAELQGAEPDRLQLGELARYLRKLSGLYDQAARAASSL
jgi:predicted MarR family transcription regulator